MRITKHECDTMVEEIMNVVAQANPSDPQAIANMAFQLGRCIAFVVDVKKDIEERGE